MLYINSENIFIKVVESEKANQIMQNEKRCTCVLRELEDGR